MHVALLLSLSNFPRQKHHLVLYRFNLQRHNYKLNYNKKNNEYDFSFQMHTARFAMCFSQRELNYSIQPPFIRYSSD
jgi:hypothetical protein